MLLLSHANPTSDAERGSGTVASLAAVSLVGFVALCLCWLGGAQQARLQAQSAADLSALAAATAYQVGQRPCSVARSTAALTNVRVTRCTASGDGIVTVATSRAVPALPAWLARPAQAQARAGSRPSLGPPAAPLGGEGADPAAYAASSQFRPPLASLVVTSPFGMRMQPVLKIYRLHAGTDFRAPCGTPVYAAASGVVASAGYVSGGGNLVAIDHAGPLAGTGTLRTRYLHLTTMAVRLGQTVAQGQLVGTSGATGGISTGCHLHFEVIVNGSPIDPMTALR